MIPTKLWSTVTVIFVLLILLILMITTQKSISEESVYGWNMMTEQERIDHREILRNLKTTEERERYRIEHHNKMQQRANEMGMTVPDMPRHRMREDSGMGSGSGYRSGSGAGAGKGR